MAGKAQKPAEQLQFQRGGRGERRTFPVAVPDAPLVAPTAPKGLKAAGTAAWVAYWSDPVSCAASGVDGYDIARYCALLDRRDALERKLRGRTEGGGDVVMGANGPILNPLHRVLKELTREIEKLREQLGILPLARMRLGLVKAQRELSADDLRRRRVRGEQAAQAIDDGAIEAEVRSVVNLDELA